MIEGIEHEDWYQSDAARAIRRYAEKKIDELVGSMREYVREGELEGAAWCEGGIQALERLRHDASPEGRG